MPIDKLSESRVGMIVLVQIDVDVMKGAPPLIHFSACNSLQNRQWVMTLPFIALYGAELERKSDDVWSMRLCHSIWSVNAITHENSCRLYFINVAAYCAHNWIFLSSYLHLLWFKQWKFVCPSFLVTPGHILIFNQGILMSKRSADLRPKYNEDPLSKFNLEFNGTITDHRIFCD